MGEVSVEDVLPVEDRVEGIRNHKQGVEDGVLRPLLFHPGHCPSAYAPIVESAHACAQGMVPQSNNAHALANNKPKEVNSTPSIYHAQIRCIVTVSFQEDSFWEREYFLP